MENKVKGVFVAGLFGFVLYKLVVGMDKTLHSEVLAKIDANTPYALYDTLSDLNDDRPMRTGALGDQFLHCMQTVVVDRITSGTEEKYILVLFPEEKMTYYYNINAGEGDGSNNEIRYIYRHRERTERSLKGNSEMYQVACTMADLQSS